MTSQQDGDRPGRTAPTRAHVAHYLDATTEVPETADFIFVPGTRLLDPARIAAELMNAKIAPLVVVTGGINRATGANEAVALHAELIARGVAPEQVLVEDRSTNTLENVVHAWKVVEDHRRDQPVTRVLAVCKWMHSRRVLMTLKTHLPTGTHYYARTYAPRGITREAWIQGIGGDQVADVMSNWNNIPEYLTRGDIAEIARSKDGGWI